MASAAVQAHMRFEHSTTRVRAEFGGVVVADSARTMVLHEGRLAPVSYFPREDVRMDLMQSASHSTFCPYKGNASYWSLTVGERVAEHVLWSYPTPYADARPLAGYVAFYTDLLDHWYEGDAEVDGHTAASEGPYANPLLHWLLNDAPYLDSPATITAGLLARLNAADMDIHRLNVVIRTLHPQRVGYSYRWSEDEAEVSVFALSYELMNSADYLNSPFVPIYEGAAGIRRRLDIDEPQLDYPILFELRDAGVTDYVAMPLLFTDGSAHALTMSTRRTGGFTTRQLGHLYEVLAVLARLYEVHANRSVALNLLDAYLGRLSGERVLEGRIRRGDHDDIEAVIWFCDLRNSTALARSLSRAEFLSLLNEFFDALAAPVLASGGEVLRFIGDAALAIFPIEGTCVRGMECSVDVALQRAMAAVEAACTGMHSLNEERAARGAASVGFGIGLHRGEVTYGNIGTDSRLEFTVVGEAANFAARVESQCKILGEQVLVSAAVADLDPARFRHVADVELAGVAGRHALYTVA